MKKKLSIVKNVFALFEKYATGEKFPLYVMLNKIGKGVDENNKEMIQEAYQDILENIPLFYEQISTPENKKLFAKDLSKIDKKLTAYLDDPELTEDQKDGEYWKSLKPIHEYIIRGEVYKVPSELANKMKMKIINSINGNNYLTAKLIVSGKIDEDVFLNFLFYNSVNTKKLYDLFLNNPEKYYNTFMFPVTPQNLPSAKKYLDENTLSEICERIKIGILVAIINDASGELLKAEFPKSYKYSILTNKYLKDNIN